MLDVALNTEWQGTGPALIIDVQGRPRVVNHTMLSLLLLLVVFVFYFSLRFFFRQLAVRFV